MNLVTVIHFEATVPSNTAHTTAPTDSWVDGLQIVHGLQIGRVV